MDRRLREGLVALGVGFVFSFGLALAGMTQPRKVIGFLDFGGGSWDPTLAFVLVPAVLVYAAGFRWITSRPTPHLAEEFQLPSRRDIDARLLTGATLFGLGWGIGGLCPGPAFTSLGTLVPEVLVFSIAMIAGMWLFGRWDAARG